MKNKVLKQCEFLTSIFYPFLPISNKYNFFFASPIGFSNYVTIWYKSLWYIFLWSCIEMFQYLSEKIVCSVYLGSAWKLPIDIIVVGIYSLIINKLKMVAPDVKQAGI